MQTPLWETAAGLASRLELTLLKPAVLLEIAAGGGHQPFPQDTEKEGSFLLAKKGLLAPKRANGHPLEPAEVKA